MIIVDMLKTETEAENKTAFEKRILLLLASTKNQF